MKRRNVTDRSGREEQDETLEREETGPSEDVLDPETRAAFERSFERHREALERLAEM